MTTILTVEDSDAVALGLRRALEREGFDVLRAGSVRDGRALASEADLILLDIRLPDGDGFELCRAIRAAHLQQPIIMLTARDETVDKIVGLEVGADDYLTKPFELRELIARIRAQLRRTYGALAGEATAVLRVAGLTLDLAAQRVTQAGRELNLTSTEWRLLAFLAHHANEAATRDALLTAVWGYDDYVGDPRTVDVHIRNLRQKIEQDPTSPALIVTVRGVGYSLRTAPTGGGHH